MKLLQQSRACDSGTVNLLLALSVCQAELWLASSVVRPPFCEVKVLTWRRRGNHVTIDVSERQHEVAETY